MKPLVLALGLGLLALGVLAGYYGQFNAQATVVCTASPYKSVVFTGQVTDATTGTGIQGVVVSFFDPPNSNAHVGGGTTTSGGYYYGLSSTLVPIRGCDIIQVSIVKTGYNYFEATFQLPENVCYPVNNSCNSYTAGNNWGIQPKTTLVPAFTWSANSLTVSFVDKTTGSPNEWFWQFGDGQTLDGTTTSAQNPVHTYSAGGTYDVKLTAYVQGTSQASTTSLVTVTYGGTQQGGTPPPSCPTGYTGTYPNCVPPPPGNTNPPPSNTTGNTTCPSGWTGEYPACYPPSKGGFDLGKFDANIASVGFLVLGAGLMLAGVAIPGGKKP